VSKSDVEFLIQYVVDHAGDHEENCPADDTCACKYFGRNQAVNRVCTELNESFLRFAVGNTVCLRSGGPKMTVVRHIVALGEVEVAWIDTEDRMQRATSIPISALRGGGN
jgi:uncharacterized protein YodC (DUF2158 family)